MAVITESLLKSRLKESKSKRLEVERSAIITPAAHQYIKDKDIELVYADMVSGPCSEEGRQDQAKEEKAYRPRYKCYATGADFLEKPEHMTVLEKNVLVFKNHPRIVFRGLIDSFISEVLRIQNKAFQKKEEKVVEDLQSVVSFMRSIQGSEISGKCFHEDLLIGLNQDQLRDHSHRPNKHYGVGHLFALDCDMDEMVLDLNSLRAKSRELEISALEAFMKEEGVWREDILRALNRLSSALYIMEVKSVAGVYKRRGGIGS